MQQADGTTDVVVTSYDGGSGRVFASPTATDATGLVKDQDGPGFEVNSQALGLLSGLDADFTCVGAPMCLLRLFLAFFSRFPAFFSCLAMVIM